MTEIIGDIVMPSELIVPTISTTLTKQPTLSGALFISGLQLYVVLGGKAAEVTRQA